MAIIKNEAVFAFKDEDYCKPRHIIVEGTYEEIGYDLGKLARNDIARSSASTVIRSMPRRSVTTSNGTGRKGLPSQKASFAASILPRTTTPSTPPI